jgi:osmoprotectant transport system substrate-binding protein
MRGCTAWLAGTAALASLTILSFSACSHGKRGIVVGSKNFTEQIVLGEILAQQLERRLHVEVTRKLSLGGTLVAHGAIVSGSVDLYPEYTGTAFAAVLKEKSPAGSAAALSRLDAEYSRRWHLHWLAPFGFNNTFAMVIRGDQSRKNSIRTLSDAARYPGGWKLGAGYEFAQREDGLPGLMRTYNLPLKGPPITMDLGLLYQALVHGQADMVAASATDGLLAARDFVVLADDKKFFPDYDCAIVAREEFLADPAARAAVAELSGKISEQEMRRLNYEADGRHRPPREVAAEFLKAHP